MKKLSTVLLFSFLVACTAPAFSGGSFGFGVPNNLNVNSVDAASSVTANSATIGNVEDAELQRLDGVTSPVQTQIDSKLTASSNLSDVGSAATARTNLGLGTGDSPQFTTLGVNTSSIAYRLNVDGGSGNGYAHFVNTTTGTAGTDGVLVGVDTVGEGVLRLRENAPLKIYTNDTEAARINSNGKMGVGVTSPSYALEVKGKSSDTITVDGVTVEAAFTSLPSNTAGRIVESFDTLTGDAYLMSGYAGADLILGVRSGGVNYGAIRLYSDRGTVVGSATGASKGAGTLNVQSGYYSNGARLTKTVILDTPELITASPTEDSWQTIDNTTLNNAGAVSAIIRVYGKVDSGSAATSDTADMQMYIRKTGSGVTADFNSMIVDLYAECNVVGQNVIQSAIPETTVNLDSNSDFDYLLFRATSGGGSFSPTRIILVGYVVEV